MAREAPQKTRFE